MLSLLLLVSLSTQSGNFWIHPHVVSVFEKNEVEINMLIKS
jgi:hypothetical protein